MIKTSKAKALLKSKLLILTTSLLMLSACNSVTDQTANVETVAKVENTISEQFIITSVENGIIKGDLLNGSGEGIYFNLSDEELKKFPAFYEVDVNDLIMIEWNQDNYNNDDWLDMNKVSYNKQGNVSMNVSMNVKKEGK